MENSIKFVGLKEITARLYQWTGSDALPATVASISYGNDQKPGFSHKRNHELTLKLLRHGHMTPFEHCKITFELTAPIFVFRQIFRYRTATISEKSLRYTDADPVFYKPEMEKSLQFEYETVCVEACNTYWNMIKAGLKKEAARSVLPVSMMSRCYFSLDMRNLFHVFDERISDHAQTETRRLVEQMKKATKPEFPDLIKCYDTVKKEKEREANNE
jgi:thymidylate synthase (FAD)